MSQRLAENSKSGFRAALWGWVVWYFTPFSGFLFTVLNKNIYATLDPANIEAFIVGSAAALGITGGAGAYYRDKTSPLEAQASQTPIQPPAVVPAPPVAERATVVERAAVVAPPAVVAAPVVSATASVKKTVEQSPYRYSKRSEGHLVQVHADLQKLAKLALKYSAVDFGITESLRDLERQQQLVAEGKSWTLNSRHLHGLAIDVVAYEDGRVTWNPDAYHKIAAAFERAAIELGIRYTWGGSWSTFDGPHFELHRDVYPDTADIELAAA